MRKILLFLVLSIVSQTNLLKAQVSLEWARQIGGDNYEYSKEITVDKDGYVYIIGQYSSSYITFGTDTFFNPSGNQNIFIVKYDSIGNLIWGKSAGGDNHDYINSITVDNDGNVIVSGYYESPIITIDSIILNNSDSNILITSDIFVIKYNSLGNLLWANSFGGNESDYSSGISTDSDGNIYMTGFYSSDSITFGTTTLNNSSGSQIFLVKFNPFGNVVWVNSMGESYSERSSSISIDFNNNIYLAGDFSGPTISFGATVLTNNNFGTDDIFVVKFDTSGNVVWAKSGGSQSNETFPQITNDLDGNLYVAGIFNLGPITFGTTTLLNPNAPLNDIYFVKYDSSGNVIWANAVGGYEDDFLSDITTDDKGDLYVIGNFYSSSISFGTDILINNFYSSGNSYPSIFIAKYENSGNVLWAKTTNETEYRGELAESIFADNKGHLYTTGCFNDTLDVDITENEYVLIPTNYYIEDIYITKYKQKGFIGHIFLDIDEDCFKDLNEIGISSKRVIITPFNIVVETNSSGVWSLDSLPVGNYTITVDTSGNWQPTCSTTQNFTVVNLDSITIAPNFGFISTQPCAAPSVSVNMPFMRPCFTNQAIYVQACNTNLATGVLTSAYVELELDSLLTPTSSSIPYTSLGNNTYSFDVGTLNPGQCVNFSVNTTVSCSAVLGQTLCMQANLYPEDSCVFDQNPTPPVGGVQPCTLPWDNSSLSVDGWCQNDTVYFSVTNNGSALNGNMQCYSPIRVYVDGVLTTIDSVLLAGGQTVIFSYFGNGQTWTLQADQHPLHPGNSHPNASVEACGDSLNWTPGLINTLSLDDADPMVDIYCGVVTGSYDPNDKTGYPLGVGNDHFVAPNGKIDYVIRFQNTGTDTAFTVVVRDTLDVDLDIFSVQSGVSSHNYSFKMYGPRVLEWTFNNILLPDSTTDEPASNGFVTFTVDQNPNLPDGTVINNRVGIYFDFNEPIITNTTTHTVNQGINYLLAINPSKTLSNNNLFIYPNPTKTLLNIVVPDAQSLKIDVYTIDGKLIEQKTITKNTALDVSKYQSGLYFINATTNKGEVFRNKFVKE
ncbi:MAG: hypothetical protein KFKLKKLM_00572 [Flavobacteriales bacterium]|nr:hypothetical protein [Flavobacteriales bacterium]